MFEDRSGWRLEYLDFHLEFCDQKKLKKIAQLVARTNGVFSESIESSFAKI